MKHNIKHVQAVLFAGMILDHEDTGAIIRFYCGEEARAYNLNNRPSQFKEANSKTADFLREIANALENPDD